jgi:hypothetical protein
MYRLMFIFRYTLLDDVLAYRGDGALTVRATWLCRVHFNHSKADVAGAVEV